MQPVMRLMVDVRALTGAGSCGARDNPVDLILLDLQMPKMDGFEVLAQLRKDPQFATIPIAALTASAMQGDRERALSAGFSVYIAKPVDLRVLRAETERLIGSAKIL
jgi:CheY-like chemotaxis protein